MNDAQQIHLKNILQRQEKIENLKTQLRQNEVYQELEKLEMEDKHAKILIKGIYKDWT